MKPVRPTKETLSKSYILQIALQLIDKDGLENFTMRKLGQEMNVSSMAVYRYFQNQGALFDGLVELIWRQALTIQPSSNKDDWRTETVSVMSQFRQTLLAHPNVLSLISTHPLVTKSEFVLVADILSELQTKGLSIQPTTVFLINSLTAYTLGFVWTEAIEPTSGGQTDLTQLQELNNHSELLSRLMQPIQNGQFSRDEQFLMGIHAILDGWK